MESQKIYKTQESQRKAINKYFNKIKSNPETNNKRLQYYKTYYLNNKLKLQNALKEIEEYKYIMEVKQIQ